MTEAQVVVVGLDAMDVDIARGLIADGRMPNLAAFIESAAWSETVNPPGFVVGGVWPTLTTGCWPSRHGFYSDLQIANGTYEAHRCDPRNVQVPRVWDTLSDAGRRCAVLDVPVTAPSHSANVVQLVEWGAHDRFVPLGSTPDTLVADVIREFGEYPVQPKCDEYIRRGDVAGLTPCAPTVVDDDALEIAAVLSER